MPRAKKTIGGAPGQPVQAVAGQTYGEGVRQEALQKTMPMPNQTNTAIPPRPPVAQQDNEATAQTQQAPTQDVMAQIAGMGGILRAPDENPNIPVTDGLTTGPGRGPDALMGGSQMEQMLRRLALQTNDPVFYEILSKVGY